ncbi:MAG: HAD-IC family P-type ATPase [Christensenellaceae bacterium]|nr:HAD-IC family P-type ATPase [Christensenellaceae bacterium]
MKNKFYGLNKNEVELLKRQGKANIIPEKKSKSVGMIIRDNIVSLFNLINFILFVLLFATGNYKNTLFMIIICTNICTGIFQEIKAKRTIDKMRVLTEAYATVIREGRRERIPVSELVLGDVFILRAGDQISVDGIVLESDDLEVNESLITGESYPILKKEHDELLSGSYVVAGMAAAKATKVGQDSYASGLMNEAKKYKRAKSEIMVSLGRIIKLVTVFIVPLGLALYFSTLFRADVSAEEALVSTAAAVIGMIPEGLMLLTTVSFAAGTIKLFSHKVIMQEPTGMEVIARVDTLCLDKTGTLTEGKLRVEDTLFFDDENDVSKLLCAFSAAFEDKNFTLSAISEKYNRGIYWQIKEKTAFTSERKYSSILFAEYPNRLFLGAPEILDIENEKKALAHDYEKKGFRVLAFAEEIEGKLRTLAMIMILDSPRVSAKDTLAYFKKQDVDIRIISGDSPETVTNIARLLAVEGYENSLDCSRVSDEELREKAINTKIFGRVSPYQKKIIVSALKEAGRTVAMTGDGTNDIPALRESDCAIAMASGADSVKSVSHIMVSDSDFSHLPYIVAEGRRVINNIERVASLFLIKTTFSVLLSIFYTIVGGDYPFMPLHMSLVSSTAVGIPAFFLALAPNNTRIKKGFFRRVTLTAIPSGIMITLLMISLEIFMSFGWINANDVHLSSLMIAEFISLYTLFLIIQPLDLPKTLLFIAMCAGFALALLLFPGLFEVHIPAINTMITVGIMLMISLFLIRLIQQLYKKYSHDLLKSD